MLVRLLYASRSAQPVSPEIVDSILFQSRRPNPALMNLLERCDADALNPGPVLQAGSEFRQKVWQALHG